MNAGKSGKKRKKDESKIGFQFNAPVTGQNQTFINGDVGNINQGLSVDDLRQLNQLFQQFKGQLQEIAPKDKQTQAEGKAEELQVELSKGQNANADRLNKIVDELLNMVPTAVGAVGSIFASPVLGALVGPATELVLNHIRK